MSSNVILSLTDPIKIIKDDITGIKYRLSLNGIGSIFLGVNRITDITYSKVNGKYLIGNSNDFLCLMSQGDSNYYNVLNNPVPNFKTDSFLQTSNINLSSVSNPIMYNTFNGTYDGNNLQLSNLNIVRDFTSNSVINMGLFTSLSNASIKNINLTGVVNVSDSSNSNIAGCDFGFISSYAENSLIENCTISAQLSNVKCMSFGGIVKDSVNSTIIRNNFNGRGNININKDYAGGIIASATNSKILFNTNSMIGNLVSSNVFE